MKKVIPAILLLFFFVKVLESQTVNERIHVVENSSSNFVCKVQINIDVDTLIVGNAVSRIDFNPKAISFLNTSDVGSKTKFNYFQNAQYQTSLTQPKDGTVAINIVNFQNGTDQITNKYIDIATLNFKVNPTSLEREINNGMLQFFSPLSSRLWNVGTFSISELGEEYIPLLLSPFNNEVMDKNTISFSWQKIELANTYHLEISLDERFSKIVYTIEDIFDTKVLVKNIDEGTKYYWRVRSISASEKSHFSEKSSFVVTIKKPSSIMSSSYNNQFVQLSWQNNSIAAQSIVIERKEFHIEKSEEFLSIDTISSNRSTYLDALIEDDKNYIYRIRAFNEHTVSKYSDTTSILTILSVADAKDNLPKDFQLNQNYPNPFNPQTTINYSVKENSNITITLYSLLGEKITSLVNKSQNAGNYSIIWNASNYPSGIYIYIMTAESIISNNTFQNVKKMILLK